MTEALIMELAFEQAIRELDQAIRERDQAIRERDQARIQLADAVDERVVVKRELYEVRQDRTILLREARVFMAQRDAVIAEMEQLRRDLAGTEALKVPPVDTTGFLTDRIGS